ncbi:MAG: MopE-related protein, partial [bacterium]
FGAPVDTGWRLHASPNSRQPDLEFEIRGFSQLAAEYQSGLRGPDMSNFFAVDAYMGSAGDAVGEDFLHGGFLQDPPDGNPPPNLCPRELQNVELCNDFDDDCDREVDEGPLYRMVDGQPVPFDELSCNTDLPGVCATGQPDCRGGEEICIPVIRPGQIDEICDGLDNDCDGVVDENTVLDPMPEVGRACDSGQPGLCQTGTQQCRDGVLICVPDGDPMPELCNGSDDNCNGQIDETFPNLGMACQNGVGICARDGIYVCADDQMDVTCNAPEPGDPRAELCNGDDDDCDGSVDEGGVCARCGDGVVGADEQCDDGNLVAGDGCSPDCQVEVDDALVPGVQQNVPAADVAERGWRECWRGTYDGVSPIADMLAACEGEQLMMACRPVGAANLQLAAEGLRADVLFDVGIEANGRHVHNGVSWYFSNDFSWGFAPGDEPVNRNSCDFNEGQQTAADQRLCWHTGAGHVTSGYRCGNNDLNDNAEWERLLFVRGRGVPCADNPLWEPVRCQTGEWVWTSDRALDNVAAADGGRTLWSAAINDAGQPGAQAFCSLDGTGYVSVEAFTMNQCDNLWYHLGGRFTGNCAGHDGETVRRLTMRPDGCFDYRNLPPPARCCP